MLLIDFNQVVISNFMQQVGAHTNVPLGEDILRHMILNTIRLNKQKFAKEDDEIVICCDSKKYWRRDVFPYYKAGRKKDREASGADSGEPVALSTTLWSEGFETVGNTADSGSRYTLTNQAGSAIVESSDGSEDYITRSDSANINGGKINPSIANA